MPIGGRTDPFAGDEDHAGGGVSSLGGFEGGRGAVVDRNQDGPIKPVGIKRVDLLHRPANALRTIRPAIPNLVTILAIVAEPVTEMTFSTSR
ncbi:hypothetical protein [Mycobacterium timonense]|uniref:Uncharacterized protein n=1 Tax=Mycobacterium timonense TaxID=701043 RepID=A0A7I9ZE15_9MYCO|nr:hypothetical protein [Mycobacterium timonense]GFG99088.1 hypothetical protein MTIM_49670 [Mycobacterium timonense]